MTTWLVEQIAAPFAGIALDLAIHHLPFGLHFEMGFCPYLLKGLLVIRFIFTKNVSVEKIFAGNNLRTDQIQQKQFFARIIFCEVYTH